MEKNLFPAEMHWQELIKRPVAAKENLDTLITEVFEAVKEKGDEALKEYSLLFDHQQLPVQKLTAGVIKQAAAMLSEELKTAILLAKGNIERFHAAQIEVPSKIVTTAGVTCWREHRAIENIGLYIPGGSAPLFSTVLMLGIPARLAGCKNITLCTPPDKSGEINPAILYAANLAGISDIYAIGGIQAIAAMSIGTETIPRTLKIFGPGNQYVTAAKQMAQQMGIAIDMPAGPSEVLIIADKTSNPIFVAADLLSQAEHGTDSQVMLLSNNESVIDSCLSALEEQLQLLPRKDIAKVALTHSKAIVLDTIEACIEFSNRYAPEHLILAIENATGYIPAILNAGSVFLGNYSCESAGDYASGTNHILPTNGYAGSYSGVSLDSFLKKITFQELTVEGIRNIGPAIEKMADAEQLWGHKNAVTLRLKNLQNV